MHTAPRSMTQLILAGPLLLLSACTSTNSTYVPDGRHGYAISCGGFLNSWSSCLVDAGRACASMGYDIIKGNEEDRSVLIACKSAAPVASAPRP